MATIYDYGDGLVEGSWMSIREPFLRVREQEQVDAALAGSQLDAQRGVFASIPDGRAT